MIDVPILLFIFRRPELTHQSLCNLRSVGARNIFIVCDGPRKISEEQDLVKRTREVVENFDFGPANVKKLFFEKNIGLKNVGIEAFNWVFDSNEFAIIYEEDTFPDESFYTFCSELLEKYKDVYNIKCISGFNFLGDTRFSNSDYFYTNFPSFWGWATWKRVWKEIDLDLISKHSDERLDEILKSVATKNRHFKYLKNLFSYWRNGSEIGGDQKILYNFWSQNGLSIVPKQNLIKNMGLGTIGATSKNPRKELLELAKNNQHSIQIKLHPTELSINKKYDEMVMSKIFAPKISFIKRVKNRLVRILRKFNLLSTVIFFA